MPGTPLKKLLLRALLLVLVLPAVQAKWHLLPLQPLNGYDQSRHDQPTFSWVGLQAGTFQADLDAYLTDNLGFREWSIRFINQLDYSLAGHLHAVDVVQGKEGVLFQKSPLGSYLGQDFMGADNVARHTRRTRDVQDSLARHGVQLLYVLAPGKAGFEPEHLPATIQVPPPGPTNYAALAQALPAAGVHVLDAAALFRKWKPTTPHPLFPRGGIHWSGYAVTRVADTLFRAAENLTASDLPDFTARPGTVTSNPDSLRGTDQDLAGALNLMRPYPAYPMAYPRVVFAPPSARQRRPNTLLIGDSFAQSFYLFYPYLAQLLDGRSRLWNYNDYVYWPEQTPPGENRRVHELDLRQQVQSRQLIILIATEQNLGRLGFGFIDEVYALYHPGEAGR